MHIRRRKFLMNSYKTIKKVALLSLVALLGSCSKGGTSTTGSSSGGEASGDTSTSSQDDKWGTLKEGYTSLANTNPNPTLNADGTYTTAGQTFEIKDTYNTTFATEPTTYNYLTTQWQYNSLMYSQMVDGLMMNNAKGGLYGGLALGYKTVENEDGTQTWTFQLKEGVYWYKNDGTKYAEVVADDFIAAMEYVLDPINGSEMSYLPMDIIDGAYDYYYALTDFENGDAAEAPDFESVGIKAVDKYTLEYTLKEPTPYFLTCLTYAVYYPVNREWLDDLGTDFGSTYNDILSNGAFLMKSYSEGSTASFIKNTNYYDAEHVYFNNLNFKYVSSTSSIDYQRKLYENGDIDGFNVMSSDKEGYKKYVTGEDGSGTTNNPYDPNCSPVASTDQFCFTGYYNFKRTTYEYPSGTHTKSESEKTATAKAICNKNFRKGFLHGLNVLEYLKYYNLADPVQRLSRTYTVKGLATDSDGKDYTEYVTDVYNKAQGTSGVKLIGTDLSEAGETDPIYNANEAKTYFAAAKSELAAQGITDSVIYIDVIKSMEAEEAGYQEAMLTSIESASEGWIKINLLEPTSDSQKVKWGEEDLNFDFSMESGWGADYGDPKSFLHTFVLSFTDGSENATDIGENLSLCGLSGTSDEKELANTVFKEFTDLYYKGVAYNKNEDYSKRLQAFAEAEYNLIYESALIIPWYTRSGIYDVVSKVIPHQAGTANYGANSDKLSNVVVSKNPITKEQRNAINAAFNA